MLSNAICGLVADYCISFILSNMYASQFDRVLTFLKKSTYIIIVFVPTLAVLLYLLSSVFTPLIVSCLDSSIIDIENRIQVFTETKEALFVGYMAVPYFYYCNMARVLHLNNGMLVIIFESVLLGINAILLVLAFYTGEN